MKKQVVALFDFDQTITDRDTLLPFLFYTSGILKGVLHLILLIPSFLMYFIGRLSRQEVKERVLKKFFGGISSEKLLELGQRYAKEVVPNNVRPKALHRILWHQKSGHRLIIVSASLDLYLKPWAQSVGIDEVLCISQEAGKIDGINCWGKEKVRRVEALIPNIQEYTTFAYGDSRGDKEMLQMADHPFYREMP